MIENEKIAAHIIALKRAALTEWRHGNPSAYVELCAPEVYRRFDDASGKIGEWKIIQNHWSDVHKQQR